MNKLRLILIASALTFLCSVSPHGPRVSAPHLVLWAWERPEDLRYIDPATTGVAYLAATVILGPDGQVVCEGRHQPLFTPMGTKRIAAIRIESPARYVIPAASALSALIAQIATDQHASAIQIDFDARRSERPFYRLLLAELHRATELPIGITALASWCEGDRWLDDQPISEATPMFFRMGRRETRDMPVLSPICQSSIGVSTDEPWPKARTARTYVFNPHPWNEADYQRVRRQAEEWK